MAFEKPSQAEQALEEAQETATEMTAEKEYTPEQLEVMETNEVIEQARGRIAELELKDELSAEEQEELAFWKEQIEFIDEDGFDGEVVKITNRD